MNEGSGGEFVCGFGDLESGLGGLAWDLGGGGGVLLSDGETSATEVRLSAEEESVGIEMTAGAQAIEVTLAPRGDTAITEGDGIEATASMATIRSAGWGRTLATPGQVTNWESDPLEGAGVFRHLAIEAAEGAVLIVVARGEPGLSGHGGERASAWLIDNTGLVRDFEEALISTQYDVEGRPTRAGLELWPGDEGPPTRASASLIGGAEAGGAWAGLFRCHGDGAEGLGTYLLWRA